MMRGFSLIEMVVSLTIMSIVFLAMGSVMMLASKAVPEPAGATQRLIDAADALEQLADELRTALTVSTAEPAVIEFTVPDRDNDGDPENIKYQWSGVPGEPLTRQYNGGNTIDVMPAVHEFQLDYGRISVQPPPVLTESSEVQLSSHVGLVSFNDFAIKDKNWGGQYFVPTGLPAEAVSWSVTRVLFEAKVHGANKGETRVQLRPALSGGLPDAVILEEYSMFENILSNGYAWQEFAFASVRDRVPGEGLCLVLKWESDADAADVRFDSIGGSGMLTSTDGGASWSSYALQSMNYYVYGTYTTSQAQPPIDVLGSVTVTLNPGPDAPTRARDAVLTLNQPAMP